MKKTYEMDLTSNDGEDIKRIESSSNINVSK